MFGSNVSDGIGSMFQGVTHLTLDDKGRFAMPSRFRDEILASCDGLLTLTVDPDQCMLIYPRPVWEPIREHLMSATNMDPYVRRLQRTVGGYAEDCDMSRQGRISIPPSIRKQVGLDREVTMVGQGKKFEMWDTNLWDKKCDEWAKEDAFSGTGGEALAAFSL